MDTHARPKVSLNSSRPLRAFPREGTFLTDESPALTAVLQAQPARIVARQWQCRAEAAAESAGCGGQTAPGASPEGLV